MKIELESILKGYPILVRAEIGPDYQDWDITDPRGRKSSWLDMQLDLDAERRISEEVQDEVERMARDAQLELRLQVRE